MAAKRTILGISRRRSPTCAGSSASCPATRRALADAKRRSSSWPRPTSASRTPATTFNIGCPRRLVDENQAVVFESLNIKGMLKNGNLARHISDASWHAFVSKVAYKAERAGRHFVQVSPWFASSKTCSSCGGKAKAMPLSVRSWAEGLSVTARGGRRKPIAFGGCNR
ncbi:transposase [Rhodothermus sp. AH-315-K08]|nr:transposase [Rhodothermus sp. AH-315-K08]